MKEYWKNFTKKKKVSKKDNFRFSHMRYQKEKKEKKEKLGMLEGKRKKPWIQIKYNINWNIKKTLSERNKKQKEKKKTQMFHRKGRNIDSKKICSCVPWQV